MAWAALALTVIGAGVSYVGQMQQAKAAEAISAQNAAMQAQNARIQAASIQAQASIQRQQAQANLKLRQEEAAARFSNATTMRDRTRAQEEMNAITLRRKREAGERTMATQRARYSAAGVVESTGSPLSLIAETAGLIQRDVGESAYAMELNQQGLYREAALERLGGKFALAGATLDADSELSGAHLRDASAQATLLTGQRQAEITRLSGASQAQGLRFGAYGSLLSAGTGLYKDFYNYRDAGAFG